MSYNTGARIVTNGLVLCLDAGNKKSYPGTGSAWFDLSKRGHTATAVNGPVFVEDGAKSHWSFDGVNDYFSSVGSENYVDIFCIFYLPYTNYLTMLFAQGGGPTVDKSLRFYNSALNATPDGNDWHTNQGSKVFINGSFNQIGVSVADRWVFLRSFRSNTNFANPFTFQISGEYQGSRYFTGKLNYLACYNRELSNAEVIQNYDALKKRFGL